MLGHSHLKSILYQSHLDHLEALTSIILFSASFLQELDAQQAAGTKFENNYTKQNEQNKIQFI